MSERYSTFEEDRGTYAIGTLLMFGLGLLFGAGIGLMVAHVSAPDDPEICISGEGLINSMADVDGGSAP